MIKNLSKSFGVYKITNLLNNKFYVGSTSDSFSRRWSNWKSSLRRCKSKSPHLENAWHLYGEDNFSFEVLETVDDKTKVLEREQYYIDILKPEYNICPKAGSPSRFNPWNKGKRQTRLCVCGKICKEVYSNGKFKKYQRTCGDSLCQTTRSREYKKSHPGPTSGRTLSKEHKAKIGKAHLGKVVSSDSREKISKSKKGKPWSEARRLAQENR